MKKPTINQQLWKSILTQSQKALAQITKHTGEIFDESVFYIEHPARVTKKSLERLKETQLKFIRTKTEEVIHNLQPKEAEELTRKIRTREQYIRHPRITTTAERERHPLTPEERSARAKKAWKTRWERMTPEEQTQYRETFKERMSKGKQAKELERQGFVPPPEIPEEPISEEDVTEVMGTPLTTEEAEEYYKNQEEFVKESDIIDFQVERKIEQEMAEATYKERVDTLRAALNNAKARDERQYYKTLNMYAEEILDDVHYFLNYSKYSKALSALNELIGILNFEPLTLDEAINQADEYDTEMDDIL